MDKEGETHELNKMRKLNSTPVAEHHVRSERRRRMAERKYKAIVRGARCVDTRDVIITASEGCGEREREKKWPVSELGSHS